MPTNSLSAMENILILAIKVYDLFSHTYKLLTVSGEIRHKNDLIAKIVHVSSVHNGRYCYTDMLLKPFNYTYGFWSRSDRSKAPSVVVEYRVTGL